MTLGIKSSWTTLYYCPGKEKKLLRETHHPRYGGGVAEGDVAGDVAADRDHAESVGHQARGVTVDC